ncbi:MarR family transcriptional regulator [Lentzea sp. NEAU-D7]|uniref:MarR family transcriptional regulator n=1 Tax=Lentzea sp. NEAU-D7 TaxID=2994667 RepID=UPI00224B2E0A|nr:helix-turn-helix domain-containing protein [Lentzea sp. NEAU-D7]MCX2948966.1 helix-turn-helix domain-containing protein [Lentzea sp. NEAU-D7]
MPSKNRTKTTTKIEKSSDVTAPETAADKLRAALTAAPGSTAVDLAASIGINKSTAGKLLARWEADGSAIRTARGVVDGRRASDLWSGVAVDVMEPEVIAEPESAEGAVPAREPFDPVPEGRLKSGALRQLVEHYLYMRVRADTDRQGPRTFSGGCEQCTGSVDVCRDRGEDEPGTEAVRDRACRRKVDRTPLSRCRCRTCGFGNGSLWCLREASKPPGEEGRPATPRRRSGKAKGWNLVQ